MFLRKHPALTCFAVLGVAIVVGLFVVHQASLVRDGKATKREKERVFPAQTIKFGLPMSVDAKVDGVWRNCRWSGMEYYLPECTDRRFDVASFTKDYTGYLKEMKRHDIRRIRVSVDHFPIEEVEELGMLEHFLVIEFRMEDDIDFDDVAALARMPNIEKLDLSWCRKIRDLSPLGKLNHLKSLSMPVTSTNESIKALRKAGVLARLRYFKTFATGDVDEPIDDYTFLEDMRNLETLDIPYSPQLLPYLTQVPSLRVLHLRRYVEDTSFFLKMPQLKELNILCDLGKPSLEHLAQLPNLERLTLRGTPTFNIDLAPLSALAKREGLSITVNHGVFRDYDLSNLSLAGICFKECDFTNARLNNTIITGCDFAPLIYSVIHDKMVPYRNYKNKGLTLDQIKSTWNYKNGRMKGIRLPEEIAAALEAERKAEEGRAKKAN